MGLTLRFIPAGSKFNLKNKKKYENSLKTVKIFHLMPGYELVDNKEYLECKDVLKK